MVTGTGTDQEMLDYGPASYVPGDRWEPFINKSEIQTKLRKVWPPRGNKMINFSLCIAPSHPLHLLEHSTSKLNIPNFTNLSILFI